MDYLFYTDLCVNVYFGIQTFHLGSKFDEKSACSCGILAGECMILIKANFCQTLWEIQRRARRLTAPEIAAMVGRECHIAIAWQNGNKNQSTLKVITANQPAKFPC